MAECAGVHADELVVRSDPSHRQKYLWPRNLVAHPRGQLDAAYAVHIDVQNGDVRAPDPPGEEHSVKVYVLKGLWFQVDDMSVERAKAAGAAWHSYRQFWWIAALVAGVIVVREFLPVPRRFGRDDD
jgi:hypothetical protein